MSNGNSFNGNSAYANGYGSSREAWWFRLMQPLPDPR